MRPVEDHEATRPAKTSKKGGAPPRVEREVDEDGEAYVAWGSGVMGEEMSAAWAVGEPGTHTVLRACCPHFGFSHCGERGSLHTSNFIKQRPHWTTLPSESRVPHPLCPDHVHTRRLHLTDRAERRRGLDRRDFASTASSATISTSTAYDASS